MVCPLPRFLLVGWFLFRAMNVPALEFHVAPDGQDTNPGTEAQPFATLEKARDTIRRNKNKEGETVTVKIRAGEYSLEKSLIFSPEDSGTTGSPVVYQGPSSGEVRLTGAVPLPVSQFKNLTSDSPFWNNLDASVREKIVVCNLREAGVSDYGAMNPIPFGAQEPAPLELFFNDASMPLARWPNE
ncbi:MAG TPA: hypothetical protein PLA90_10650, partial [Candidatus Sumerlaeota bacterium]|nr:hypothetical protein [Candidatus Sumerlaeota bacterium]